VRTPSTVDEFGSSEEGEEAAQPPVRTRRRRLRLIEARVRDIQARCGKVVARDLVRWLRRKEHSRVSVSTVNGLL
jgi:hypothetical protein